MRLVFLACFFFLTGSAIAQHPQGYAGHQARDIKALSGEEIKQYRSGAGMSFALAAELNRYPGPMHALELADELNLSDKQRGSLQALMDNHKAEARAIGARLVEAERELDGLFASKNVTATALRAKVRAAGDLRSEYRLSHLDTHRRTRELLTAEQVEHYDHLRGYARDGHK